MKERVDGNGAKSRWPENFNVISKRRYRISGDRNAPEVEWKIEEGMRLRDRERIHMKERDRLNGKQKRIESASSIGGDGSSEKKGEEEERSVHRSSNLPQNQPFPSSSMSILHRRTVAPARIAAKSSPANEIIGLHIPKKARSVKRTHEYCNSGTRPFGEEKNHRKLSPLSTSRCGDGGLPSSLSISSKRNKLLGPNTRRHVKFSYSSSLVQDEIEVVEALFDLMKHSPSQSQSLSPSQGFTKQSDCSNERICSSSSIPAQTSDLHQEDDGDAVSVQNGSIAEKKTLKQSNKMGTERIESDSRDSKNKENGKEDRGLIDQAMELAGGGRAETKVELVSAKVEDSQSCAKFGADNLSASTETKVDPTFMVVETKQKTNPEIVQYSNPMKSPSFLLSSPRLKKCATHQYIALNIKHHQQLVKNLKWHAPAGTNINWAILQNHSLVLSACPLLGDVCGGLRLNTIPVLRGKKDQTTEITSVGNSSKDSQLMLQHPLLLFSASNSQICPGYQISFPIQIQMAQLNNFQNYVGNKNVATLTNIGDIKQGTQYPSSSDAIKAIVSANTGNPQKLMVLLNQRVPQLHATKLAHTNI